MSRRSDVTQLGTHKEVSPRGSRHHWGPRSEIHHLIESDPLLNQAFSHRLSRDVKQLLSAKIQPAEKAAKVSRATARREF